MTAHDDGERSHRALRRGNVIGPEHAFASPDELAIPGRATRPPDAGPAHPGAAATRAVRAARGAGARARADAPTLTAHVAAGDTLAGGRLSFELRAALQHAHAGLAQLERTDPAKATALADEIAAARTELAAVAGELAPLFAAAPRLEDLGPDGSPGTPTGARAWDADARAIASQLGLGDVDIRADDSARGIADAEGARGVALGSTIYLHPDRLAPGTPEGREVLAHELVHVAQGRLAADTHDVGRDEAEQEAATLATRLVAGERVGAPLRWIDLARPAADRHAKPKLPKGTSVQDQLSKPDADLVLQAAADVVKNRLHRLIAGAPAQYTAILYALYAAVTGSDGHQTIGGRQRREWFDAAIAGLEPAMAVYRDLDGGAIWLKENLSEPLKVVRVNVMNAEAHERVDNAVRLGEREIVEVPGDGNPREQAGALRSEIAKLVPTTVILQEQLIRLHHDAIHHEAEAMLDAGARGKKLGPGTLATLQQTLMVVDGYLILSDEEFAEHLDNIHGVADGVATYAEFVKASIELVGGAVCILASYMGAIGKLLGDADFAASMSGLSRLGVLKLANVIAAVEIVRGIALLFDSTATRQEKLDGAVSAASGAAWFVGKRIGGAAVGAAASSAIILGYMELEWALGEFWSTTVGIGAGNMGLALAKLREDGVAIATSADALAKCGLLRAQEADPEKAAALDRTEAALAGDLGACVDGLISDCMPRLTHEAGIASMPGTQQLLVDLIAPLRPHRGATTPKDAAAAAAIALEKVAWALAHASDLVVASVGESSLADVQAEVASRKQGGEEGTP